MSARTSLREVDFAQALVSRSANECLDRRAAPSEKSSSWTWRPGVL